MPPCLDIGITGDMKTIAPVANPADPANWGARVDDTVQPTNLAVPGARVMDIQDTAPDTAFFGAIGFPYDTLWNLILDTPAKTTPMSMMDQAEMLINERGSSVDRDVVLFWIGNNDALWAAISGNPALLTSTTDFETEYTAAMARLGATGSKIIVGNIPDVTVIPHLIPAGNALVTLGVPIPNVGTILGALQSSSGTPLTVDDYITLGGMTDLGTQLTALLTTGNPVPLKDTSVLTAGETAQVQTAVTAFNGIIATAVNQSGVELVDVNALLTDIKVNDVTLPTSGTVLTTDFCGGLFTLDGIHPTNTGYAVIANAFITTMNAAWGFHIPLVNLETVYANEPAKNRCIKPVNFVVVGDSLSAGVQNSCLQETQQVNGYANRIATQAGWPLDLPLVNGNGAPPCLTIGISGDLTSIAPVADQTVMTNWGARVDGTIQPTDLAVPGARVLDIQDTVPDTAFFNAIGYPFEPLWDLVLNQPAKSPAMSMVDQAEALIARNTKDTDIVVFWIGNNDALWAALTGTHTVLTPTGTFNTEYDAALSRLAGTGAKIIVGNIPDVTVIPHMIPAGNALVALGVPIGNVPTVLTALESSAGTSLTTGDYITLTGMADLGAQLTAYSTDGSQAPLANSSVLTAAETVTVQAAVQSFNASIASAAATYGAELVDVNALLTDAKTYGFTLSTGGTVISTAFCGGVFTLDGIHPTNTGYAVVANAFIDTINTAWGYHIPIMDLETVYAAEPLKHFCIAPQ